MYSLCLAFLVARVFRRHRFRFRRPQTNKSPAAFRLPIAPVPVPGEESCPSQRTHLLQRVLRKIPRTTRVRRVNDKDGGLRRRRRRQRWHSYLGLVGLNISACVERSRARAFIGKCIVRSGPVCPLFYTRAEGGRIKRGEKACKRYTLDTRRRRHKTAVFVFSLCTIQHYDGESSLIL